MSRRFRASFARLPQSAQVAFGALRRALNVMANKETCSCACHTWSTANPKKFEGQKILDQILDANVCEHGIHAPHKVGYGSTWCPGVRPTIEKIAQAIYESEPGEDIVKGVGA